MSQTKAQLIDNLVQPITGALGSASAPTFSFTADPNTGVYSPGADQLALSTGGVERFTIDANGKVTVDTNTLCVDALSNRVGVGTTNPSFSLHVVGGDISLDTLDGRMLGFGLSSTFTASITTASYGLTRGAAGTNTVGLSGFAGLTFYTNSTERARIDSSGRLLVGNSTARVGEPQGGSVVGYTLSSTFEGTSTVPGSVTAIQNSAAAAYDGPYFYLARTRGTVVGSSTIVVSGDNLGTIAFAGADGTDIRTKAAEIYAQVDGTPGANDMPGRLVLSTTADGASSPTERLRIDSVGDITIAGGGLIKADFSNATIPNRTYFQTTTANSPTVVGAIPNGTSFTSAFYAFNDSDPGNSAYGGIFVDSTKAVLNSAITGTGTYLPLVVQTNNQEQARFTTTDRYFRMAASTGGIQFNGDTAAANALDDYEEGTFTPTIIGTTLAGTGTYSSQIGRYTKIGNRVFYSILISWSAHTGTVNMEVSGLPFTAQSTTNNIPPASITSSNLAVPANSYPSALVVNNTTTIRLYSVVTGGSAIAALAIDTAATLYLSGHYETA
jgi:hypothetical protein